MARASTRIAVVLGVVLSAVILGALPLAAQTDGVGRVEGEGGDILVLLLVGIGGLVVVGTIVYTTGRARAHRSEWRTRALGAIHDAQMMEDALVPGRFGSGLEARALLSDARRRVDAIGSAAERGAPSASAGAALAELRDRAEALREAFEADLVLRTSAVGAARARDGLPTSEAVLRCRHELATAIEDLSATL